MAVHDGVVLSLVIIAQVIERGSRGLRRRVLRSRDRGRHCLGDEISKLKAQSHLLYTEVLLLGVFNVRVVSKRWSQAVINTFYSTNLDLHSEKRQQCLYFLL